MSAVASASRAAGAWGYRSTSVCGRLDRHAGLALRQELQHSRRKLRQYLSPDGRQCHARRRSQRDGARLRPSHGEIGRSRTPTSRHLPSHLPPATDVTRTVPRSAARLAGVTNLQSAQIIGRRAPDPPTISSGNLQAPDARRWRPGWSNGASPAAVPPVPGRYRRRSAGALAAFPPKRIHNPKRAGLDRPAEW